MTFIFKIINVCVEKIYIYIYVHINIYIYIYIVKYYFDSTDNRMSKF